jgi:type III pantothenate kinase
MMLLIDIGNSRIKAGQCLLGGIQPLKPCAWRKAQPTDCWSAVLQGLPRPERVLVSNVAGNAIATALKGWVATRWALEPEFVTVRQDFAGVHTRYERPAQLGVDRWLAALAGFHLAKGPCCVIDSGTALTVDIVTAEGQHIGGLIAPGLNLMARSLTQGTAQLALDEVQGVDHFATNTAAAISLGCREAVAGLIARVAGRIARDLPGNPAWFVTGGEAATVEEFSPVPLTRVPDLVLQGLRIVAERDA